jgi:hypothetical protein
MTPEAKYERLVKEMSSRAGVTTVTAGKGFGSTGQLKVDGRIFAMLVRGSLVLKLPRARVDELVEAGAGLHFDAGKGKPMREWFALSGASKQGWGPLAAEAYYFVKELAG